ncbi:hypothetical protein AMS68_000572 [Peltaster fructicola]|uniref:Uncharacterized protein n=1 Tax=Peltaster fructicola TaxID=286661 RepID=A0A6H0XKA6_9PEZI|nr:hypothetical protein AMS68_000572 [Peltaster fructicola]
MASPLSPPGSIRRAGRNASHPMRRTSTKGPLETAEDPLAATPAPPEVARVNTEEALPQITPSKAQDALLANITRTLPPHLRFLQDPRLYHQIAKDDVPAAFLQSTSKPSSTTPLTDLLGHGHFRQAAEVALRELLQASIDDAQRILQLLYCRLACLTLISRPDVAADEALPLLDFITSNASGVSEAVSLIPWSLRILLVRLQSIAAQDGGRRAIMALYGLAGEARANIRDARSEGDEDARSIWASRLFDLGLRVSDTLVEMGELETATRHLETLVGGSQDEVLIRKVLLRLRTGDVITARRHFEELSQPDNRAVYGALLSSFDADVTDAVMSWRSLSQLSSHEVAAQNEAVFLLYSGRIDEALHILETLVEKGLVFYTLLFNLSTMHELCSDNAESKKQDIAAKLASRAGQSSSTAWERSVVELKL